MPVKVEVHIVPHFKAPVNAKVELWRLACGGTFTVQTSLLKIGCLVHKLGFVATEVAGTVKQQFFKGLIFGKSKQQSPWNGALLSNNSF